MDTNAALEYARNMQIWADHDQIDLADAHGKPNQVLNLADAYIAQQAQLAKKEEQLRVAVECLEILVMQRDAHFHTIEAWDNARTALQQIAAMDGVAKQEQVKA